MKDKIHSELKQKPDNKLEWAKSATYLGISLQRPTEDQIKKIPSQFDKFVETIKPILSGISTDYSALGVIRASHSYVDQMLRLKYPVNITVFLYRCLLEAISSQYTKSKDLEEAQMVKQINELEKSQMEEENRLLSMIKESQNVYQQGVTTAQKCFKEMLDQFCQNHGVDIQTKIMGMIREEFPDPREANVKAYKHSFTTLNSVNMVKYVLNINKFIRELYDERIRTIEVQALDKAIQNLTQEFIKIIESTDYIVEEWRQTNLEAGKIQISSLSDLAKCTISQVSKKLRSLTSIDSLKVLIKK